MSDRSEWEKFYNDEINKIDRHTDDQDSDDSGYYDGPDGGYGHRYSDGSGYYDGADGSHEYRYSDGSGYYDGADGSHGYRYSDGSGYYDGADGSHGYRYSDGSGYFDGANGSHGYIYSDGSAYFDDEDGEHLTYDSNERQESSYHYDSKDNSSTSYYSYSIDDSFDSDISNTQEQSKPRRRRRRIGIRIFAFVYVIGFIIGLFSIIFIRVDNFIHSKRIPFSSEEVVGRDLDEVYEQLEKVGFTHIKTEEVFDGYGKSGVVSGVKVGYRSSYEKKELIRYDTSITIFYYSDERVDITDVLKKWKKTSATEIQKRFFDKGFTNVVISETDTYDRNKEGKTSTIVLNGEDYSGGECYIPYNSQIEIGCYIYKICIGNDNNGFVGQNYDDVYSDLLKKGYENVTCVADYLGWQKADAIVEVNINGSNDYLNSDNFVPDTPIIIKYSGQDRIDVTAIVENWQTKDYLELKQELNNSGICNVTTESIIVYDKELNGLTSSLLISDRTYESGECYLYKYIAVTIKHNFLHIKTTSSAETYLENVEENYKNVVQELKDSGFTNITVYRNDSLLTGWITKEGSIESITIDGIKDFDIGTEFNYNAPIIIIVNTYKNKGCEDISLIYE